MITNVKEALLFLVQKQHGSWDEIQSQVEPKLIEWFETMGYIYHCKDKWHITSAGIRQSLYYRDPTPEERELGCFLYDLDVH